ncbi:MAG: helix-turn-helix transcriptional regulator [Microbacterium sp.]|nr:helix-turn-helix transcriptional regulator [Microbacterium sp.]
MTSGAFSSGGFGDELDIDAPIFVISVAAELASLHPQTLRQYDRLGLVSPKRTAGLSRRYSMRDVAQLREVARLSSEGLNLEGIRRIIELENRVADLQARMRDLETALADALVQRQVSTRVFAAGTRGDVVSLRQGVRPERPGQVVVWRPGRH